MKLNPKYKAVCFDMDGTLLNTKVDYVKMANVAFDEMVRLGVPETAIDRSESFKFNIDSGIEYLKKHNKVEDIYKIGANISKMARDIEMERVDEARPFDGTNPLLDLIHSFGLSTGVLTRGCREYAEAVLKKCDSLKRVDCLIARDDYPEEESKPSPIAMQHMADRLNVKTNEILYFGDHGMDYRCAKDAGTDFIAVTTGAFRSDDWMKEGVKVEFDSITDFYRSLMA
ncbi:HAD family hydrolase [Candidatus Methanarcanum hacksteinii]|uniref:HAD family hydrolase n=1 Tax=Candidatus Methanarcanum hacksteinii TaxID=2911857 RepID=UPI0037DDC229|nr:MAG: hypothetical protein A3204_03115 [Candidatus Methanarcanum hacksteinii]